MDLLFSEGIKKQLADELAGTFSSIHIISAYCKHDAIRFIEDHIDNGIPNKKLMVRFRLDDIVQGASDLCVYEYCKENNWQLYVRFDLHAKTYVFDRVRGIVGSANLTRKGIGLSPDSNFEIAHLAQISSEEMSKIDSLFDKAILMSDDLYFKMNRYVNENIDKSESSHFNWPPEIMNQFVPKVDVLFTHEFPNCSSLSNLQEDSLDFLGLDIGWDIDELREAFVSSNVFRWLIQTLEKAPGQAIYYGALSAALHETVLNDPKPYRKEVKKLQSNLLNWVQELNITNVVIERPNHSQRIRLIP